MASQALGKGALWMQNVDYPAAWDRTLIDALYPTEGVIDGFAVTANGGLGISVSAGRAVVLGDTVANQGKYLVDQDSAVTLTLASVGSNRTEYVWLSINDTAVAGGRAGNNVTIETSTTAVPASALLLATITLVAGTVTITSEMIADNRVYADVVPPASITTAKLVDSSVTSAKIADGTIVAADLASASVTTSKIADAAVTLAKLEATLQATLATIDPADAIIAIGGTTAPAGYGLCDGGLELIASYPATYARIGTTFGGDGINTFGKPNLQSRFIAGKGTAAWSNVVNEQNAASAKDAVAVSHSHTTLDHWHTTTDHVHTIDQHRHTWGGTSGGSSQDIVRRINNSAHSGFWTGTNTSPQDSYLDINAAGALALVWAGMAVDYTTNHTHDVSGNTSYVSLETNGAKNGTGNATSGATGSAGAGTGNTTNSQSPSESGTDKNLPPYVTLNYCIRLR